MFIAPPGCVKPVEPKIVMVSTLCSTNATSPSAASQRGAVSPRSASNVTGAIIVVVAPVSTGPMKSATSRTVRVIAGSRAPACSARPPHVQVQTAIDAAYTVAPKKKM
jgi:hypothetical protein